jgi:hypothetical protein
MSGSHELKNPREVPGPTPSTETIPTDAASPDSRRSSVLHPRLGEGREDLFAREFTGPFQKSRESRLTVRPPSPDEIVRPPESSCPATQARRVPDGRGQHPLTYLFHLVVPSLLLIDILHAGRLGMAVKSDLLLAALAGTWVLLALGAFLAARDRSRFLQRIRGPMLGLYAVFLCGAALELALWGAYRHQPPAVWRPGTQVVFRPDLRVFPGVSAVTHFRVNELGLRGPALDHPASVYKIVAVGGSTTLSLMLDGPKTWPEQLMEEMNAGQHQTAVWVGNAGVNGHTAVHHLTLLRHLPILRQADLILFLSGLNDFQSAMAFEGKATQAKIQETADQYRDYLLGGAASPFPLYRHLGLYRFARRVTDAVIERVGSEGQQESWDEIELRRRRAAGAVLPMPDLTLGRDEYRQRLQSLASECTFLQRRCVFLTQPTLWRPDLQTDVEKLLLFGWVGPKFRPRGYVSVAELSQGMDSYNRVMLDVCRRTHLECFDLAAALPKDTSVFYDDAHFTENGARLVARALSHYLLSLPPFKGGVEITRATVAVSDVGSGR